MDIETFYAQVGGNYEEALGRLMNEALVKRFVKKFPADPSFEALSRALEENRFEEAFRAVHSLKGVSGNLALTQLSDAACELTELLRGGNSRPEEIRACYIRLELAYQQVIQAIEELA